MMSDNKISVAIAVFNGSKYIAEQIKSIVNQSVKPHEIIISDDGSSDDSIKIAEDILRNTGVGYTIISNKYSRGFSNNFQSALECCTGDVVFLSDQDDFWMPDKIEKCIEKVVGVNKYLLIHDMFIGDAKLAINDKTYLEEMIFNRLNPDDYCSGCAMVIDKDLLDVALPFPAQLRDHDIWVNEIAKSLGQRVLLHSPLSIYRRHGKNLTTNKIFDRRKFVNFMSSLQEQWSGEFFYRQKMLIEEISIRISERRRVLSRIADVDAVLLDLKLKSDVVNMRINCKKLGAVSRLYCVVKQYGKSKIGVRHALKDIFIGIHRES